MSTAVWYVFMLVPVIAIAYVVWAYRNKAAEKEARSRERLVALVGIPHGAGAAPRPQPAAAPAAQPATVSQPATAVAPAAAVSLLTPPERLLYYVLKAGLPDHEIFPHVSLASVLGAPAGASGPALDLQRRFARQDIDFAVCDKSMRVVAGLVLDDQARGLGTESLSRALAVAGIRLVTVSAGALPRREQVRGLIYGP